MNNTSYNSADLTKFLMAILIIIAHTAPLTHISTTGNYLLTHVFTRIGVPYFYVMAGFFLFKKMQENNIDYIRIKKYCFRTISLYISWNIIYLLLGVYLKHQNNLIEILQIFLTECFLKEGCCFHLWFLYNLILAVFFIALLLYMKISIDKIVVIAAFLYILGLFSSAYHGLFEILFPAGNAFNEIFTTIFKILPLPHHLGNGFLFMSIGALIAVKQWYPEKKYLIIGLFLSWIALLYEAYFTKFIMNWLSCSDSYIMLVPVTIFTVFLSMEIHLPNNRYWIRLRKMSVFMYLVHPLFEIPAIEMKMVSHSLILFISVAFFSILFAYLFVILKERYNWLNKLG